MTSRDELGLWMTARGYTIAAEVGVWKGEFSARLLCTWSGQLHMIDAWRHLENYQDQCNLSDAEHEECFAQAMRVAEVFTPRAIIWRELSPAAAANFPDHFFDLVYLDGDHSYESVKRDLAAWAPKVRPGGTLCGHDFMDGVRQEGVFGVKTAVCEFFGRPPEIVTNDYYPSWFYTA
jgi:hypothetical protein